MTALSTTPRLGASLTATTPTTTTRPTTTRPTTMRPAAPTPAAQRARARRPLARALCTAGLPSALEVRAQRIVAGGAARRPRDVTARGLPNPFGLVLGGERLKLGELASAGLNHLLEDATVVADVLTDAVGLKAAPGALEAQDARDRTRIRALLREALQAATAAPAEAPAQMRAVLGAHPEVLEWIVQRRSLGRLLSEAGIPMAPGASSRAKLLRHVGERLGPFEDKAITLNPLVRAILDSPSAGLRAACVARVPGWLLSQIGAQLREVVEATKLSELDAVKALRADGGLDVQGLPQALKDVVDAVLRGYFDMLPAADKHAIFVGLLELPPEAGLAAQLSVVLNHCGPALQKVFQLVGGDTESKAIQEAMQALKDRVKPIDGAQARAIVVRALDRPFDEVFAHFDERPLATATVGQVHKATLASTGEVVIVKVMKPGLRERMTGEFAAFRALATAPSARQLLDNLERALTKELDFRTEWQNTVDGQVYDVPHRGTAAVKVTAGLPATADVLVMAMAPGKGIDTWTPTDVAALGISQRRFLHIKADTLRRALADYLRVATSGRGPRDESFAHADLHGGNVFFELKRGGRDPRVTYIDFGSVARPTAAQRAAFRALSCGVFTGSVEHTVNAIALLAGALRDDDRAALNDAVRTVIRGRGHPVHKVTDIVFRAINLGVSLPEDFLQFHRGRLFLHKQIDETYAALDVHDPDGVVKRPRLLWPDLHTTPCTYEDLYVSRALRDVPGEATPQKLAARFFPAE